MQQRKRAPGWVRYAILLVVPALGVAGIRLLERHLWSRAQKEKLERIPFLVTGWDRPTSEPAAAKERVIIAKLFMNGETKFRTGPVPPSRGMPGQTLDAADAQLPPWTARDEVREGLAGNRTFGRYWTPDGSVLVQTLAQPVPEGGCLYILTGMHVHKLRQPLWSALFSLVITLPIVLVVVIMADRRRRKPPDPAP
jgi:hypothetical protein